MVTMVKKTAKSLMMDLTYKTNKNMVFLFHIIGYDVNI